MNITPQKDCELVWSELTPARGTGSVCPSCRCHYSCLGGVGIWFKPSGGAEFYDLCRECAAKLQDPAERLRICVAVESFLEPAGVMQCLS